jgi:hypothetical protein
MKAVISTGRFCVRGFGTFVQAIADVPSEDLSVLQNVVNFLADSAKKDLPIDRAGGLSETGLSGWRVARGEGWDELFVRLPSGAWLITHLNPYGLELRPLRWNEHLPRHFLIGDGQIGLTA